MAKMLVVEGEGIFTRDIKNSVEGKGYAVPAIAFTGEEAIEKAEELRLDLVLMDIVLKGDMDGIKAAEQIRNRSFFMTTNWFAPSFFVLINLVTM